MLDITYTKLFKSFFRGASGNNNPDLGTLYFKGFRGFIFEIDTTIDTASRKTLCTFIACCDFFGNEIALDLPEKEIFEKTFAEFYWNNLLNQIAERTFLRKKKDIREGYVLSTLDKKAYAGTRVFYICCSKHGLTEQNL